MSAAHHDASARAGRYNKRLLPKAAFAALTATMSKAHTEHYENSLPWDDQGSRLLTVATDEDGDGRGERVREVASGLRMPSGVGFRDGALYVAAVSTILRFDDIESRLDDPPAPVIVTDRLPSEGHHGSKVLEFGPDGLLYLPVGAPCDVCRTEGFHGTILRMHRDGSGTEVYAWGLRNSVGLAWHPVTGELWFTDNGSDHLGPNLPPGPGESTGSGTCVNKRPAIPPLARAGQVRWLRLLDLHLASSGI